MKKCCYLSIFFLLCLTFNSYSQFTLPFPDSLAVWTNTEWIGPDPLDPLSTTVSSPSTISSVGQDSLNGELYTFITHDYTWSLLDGPYIVGYYVGWNYIPESIGYYRVDSSKVYYTDHEPGIIAAGGSPFNTYTDNHFNTSGEILLYDFGLVVGDTFNVTTGDTLVVESIDSILINSYYYKRINFDPLPGPWMTLPDDYFWIEGIGSSLGFYPYVLNFESGSYFECFHEYWAPFDQMSYDSYSHSGACLTANADEYGSQRELSISPNPSNGEIQIQNAIEGTNLNFLDASGRTIITVPTNSSEINVDISDFAPGTYFIVHQNKTYKLMKF